MDVKVLLMVLTATGVLGCSVQPQNTANSCDPNLVSCAEESATDKPLYIPPVDIDQADLQRRIAVLKRWLAWQRAVSLGETDEPFEDESQLISTLPDLSLAPVSSTDGRIEALKQLAASGADNDALQLTQEMLDLEPDNIDLILLCSSLLTQQQRYSESSALLDQALLRFPLVPELYNNQAVNRAAAGNLGEAVELLQSAFATHPSFGRIQANLKSLYQITAQRALSPDLSQEPPKLLMLESQY